MWQTRQITGGVPALQKVWDKIVRAICEWLSLGAFVCTVCRISSRTEPIAIETIALRLVRFTPFIEKQPHEGLDHGRNTTLRLRFVLVSVYFNTGRVTFVKHR